MLDLVMETYQAYQRSIRLREAALKRCRMYPNVTDEKALRLAERAAKLGTESDAAYNAYVAAKMVLS